MKTLNDQFRSTTEKGLVAIVKCHERLTRGQLFSLSDFFDEQFELQTAKINLVACQVRGKQLREAVRALDERLRAID